MGLNQFARMGPWHVVLVGQARQSVVCAYAPPMVSTTGPLQGDIKAHCVTCSYLIGCLLASQRVRVRKILITQQRAFMRVLTSHLSTV